jgi:hypothetical protein
MRTTQAKKGRFLLASKYRKTYQSNIGKSWAEIRKNPEAQKLIQEARTSLGYSPKTVDCDIYHSLLRTITL